MARARATMIRRVRVRAILALRGSAGGIGVGGMRGRRRRSGLTRRRCRTHRRRCRRRRSLGRRRGRRTRGLHATMPRACTAARLAAGAVATGHRRSGRLRRRTYRCSGGRRRRPARSLPLGLRGGRALLRGALVDATVTRTCASPRRGGGRSVLAHRCCRLGRCRNSEHRRCDEHCEKSAKHGSFPRRGCRPRTVAPSAIYSMAFDPRLDQSVPHTRATVRSTTRPRRARPASARSPRPGASDRAGRAHGCD